MEARNKFTILLVDDCVLALKAQSAMLEHLGYKVLGADNAYLALQILREKQIDIVITDVEMPYINGEELSYLIHRHCPALPIVALTTLAKKDLVKTEVSKFKEILEKPLKIDQVKKVITQFTNRTR